VHSPRDGRLVQSHPRELDARGGGVSGHRRQGWQWSHDRAPSSKEHPEHRGRTQSMSHPMSYPKVSAIMPVYNGERHVQQAIDSVVSQHLRPTELLIVDDGSTDGSRKLLESIEVPFAKHVLHQENRLQSAARNLAASVATGTYLAFLDHD